MDTQPIGTFIQNLLLLFSERDICSLRINETYYAKGEIEKYLNLNTNEMVAAVALGYSDEKIEARPRMPLSEISL